MANTFSPFGFRQFGRLDGGSPTAGFDRWWIASSDTNTYFTGDTVYFSSAQNFGTNPQTISNFTASSGYIPLGVFMGCKYYSAAVGRTVWSSYFPGSVGSSSPCEAYVCTDPEQRYIAQASTTGGVMGSSNVGWGIGIASSVAGNTLNGISGQALASSVTTLQSATSPYRIIDVYSNWAPPGVNGTSTGSEGGAILVVTPNLSFRSGLNAAST